MALAFLLKRNLPTFVALCLCFLCWNVRHWSVLIFSAVQVKENLLLHNFQRIFTESPYNMYLYCGSQCNKCAHFGSALQSLHVTKGGLSLLQSLHVINTFPWKVCASGIFTESPCYSVTFFGLYVRNGWFCSMLWQPVPYSWAKGWSQ